MGKLFVDLGREVKRHGYLWFEALRHAGTQRTSPGDTPILHLPKWPHKPTLTKKQRHCDAGVDVGGLG